MNEIQQLGAIFPAGFDATAFAVDLLLAAILSSALAAIYSRLHRHNAYVAIRGIHLVLLAISIVLIVSVVRSSIALSLGLVGSLSIIRFRSAIKDPTELMFLFATVGIGIGMGAGYRWPTLFTIVLFAAVAVLDAGWRSRARSTPDSYQLTFTTNSNDVLQQCQDTISSHNGELLRISHHAGTHTVVYILRQSITQIEDLSRQLQSFDSDLSVSAVRDSQ